MFLKKLSVRVCVYSEEKPEGEFAVHVCGVIAPVRVHSQLHAHAHIKYSIPLGSQLGIESFTATLVTCAGLLHCGGISYSGWFSFCS